MVTSGSAGIIKNSVDQRRGHQRSGGKINLSNNLGDNGAEPQAGNAVVGGATLTFLAMRGDSVTADSHGFIFFECLCQKVPWLIKKIC